ADLGLASCNVELIIATAADRLFVAERGRGPLADVAGHVRQTERTALEASNGTRPLTRRRFVFPRTPRPAELIRRLGSAPSVVPVFGAAHRGIFPFLFRREPLPQGSAESGRLFPVDAVDRLILPVRSICVACRIRLFLPVLGDARDSRRHVRRRARVLFGA